MESILSVREPSQGDRKVMTNRSSPNPAAMRRTTIMPSDCPTYSLLYSCRGFKCDALVHLNFQRAFACSQCYLLMKARLDLLGKDVSKNKFSPEKSQYQERELINTFILSLPCMNLSKTMKKKNRFNDTQGLT